MFNKYFDSFVKKFSRYAMIIMAFLFCFSIGNLVNGAFQNTADIAYSKYQAEKKRSASRVDSLVLWPHEKSDLQPDPALVFKKLPNGFRFVLMENHYPKNRVGMHLNVQVGSLYESDDEQGLAHFLEHMLFNGSTHFKPEELVKFFQSIGMQFGPDANAHTGFNETVYDILLPEGSKESLEKGLTVMKDFAEGALLLSSEIDKERRVVLSEKRTRDSASYRTYISTAQFEFPDALISERFPIGREEVLKKSGRKPLKKFYDTWYRPEKMILVLVGDFNAELAVPLIEEQFYNLSPRAPPGKMPDLGKIRHKGIKPFYHFENESGNTTVSIETIQKTAARSDSFDFQKQQLIKDMANRIVNYRLDAMVRKADTPFTSASISSGYFLNQIKYSDITADCNPENWERSLFLIEQTLRKALKFGFVESELDRVKKDILSDLENAVKKASTRNSRSLANEIIWSLNTDRVFMSPEQKKELFTPIINAVTLETLHSAFKDVWSPDHRLVLVTGNANLKNQEKSPNTQILNAYLSSMRIAVKKSIDKKSITFPYLQEPHSEGQILKIKEISDLGIIQVDFENGVRLNLKKTDFKADQVMINLSFGSGKSSEPSEKPGLSLLSTQVINESGFGTLAKDEIERALAGKNARLTFGVDEDRFSFEGQSTREEVPLLFELLYTHIVDPGFREDAYTLSQERFRQKYRTLSRSIDGAMALSGRRFLAGGDHRFGLPDDDTFKRMTLENVKSWIKPSLKNDDIEISVVGDFDVDSVIKLTGKFFGSLPLDHIVTKQKASGLPRFPVGQHRTLSVSTEIHKGLVIIAYPTEDLWNIGRTRRLSVLSEIVTDRLRERIREKLGSAYSTFAFNRASRAYPGYGVFQTMAYVSPTESDIVIREIKKIVSDISENGVSQDELRRAKTPTLTSIKDMLRKNDYWLNTVLTGSKKHPQQIDWSRTIKKDYTSITEKEMSNYAKKYLVNDKAATIIVIPK